MYIPTTLVSVVYEETPKNNDIQQEMKQFAYKTYQYNREFQSKNLIFENQTSRKCNLNHVFRENRYEKSGFLGYLMGYYRRSLTKKKRKKIE